MSLSISLFGQQLKNPLFLPSGIVNEVLDHRLAVEAGVGCLVLKSVTIEKREGNPLPRVVKFDCGFINSVGLRNPGLFEAKKQIKDFLKKYSTPTIISVFAASVSDFQKLVGSLVELSPFAIELNLSCPNVANEFGEMLSTKTKMVYQVVKVAKKEAGKVPIIAKLSPNVENIGEVAKAAEEGGADAISAINTLASGMVIDIKKRKPILGAKKGGISGKAIKPLAVVKVYEIYEAVKIPILGMGGVSSWQDVVEMMMAGATLVGVGSAVYTQGWGVYQEILSGLKKFLNEEKIPNIKSLIGIAH
jgi:dihydroorotate dehydrogenase (NAD+) catalytic subunit